MIIEENQMDILNFQVAWKSLVNSRPILVMNSPASALEYLQAIGPDSNYYPSHIFVALNNTELNGMEFIENLRNQGVNPDTKLYLSMPRSIDETDLIQNDSRRIDGYIHKYKGHEWISDELKKIMKLE